MGDRVSNAVLLCDGSEVAADEDVITDRSPGENPPVDAPALGHLGAELAGSRWPAGR